MSFSKEVVGVRFRPNGKIYFFDPLDYNVQVGTDVIVETTHGVEYGKCVLGRRTINDQKRISGLRPIIRIASAEDTEHYEFNKKRSKEAYDTCMKKVNEHGLAMKLISAEYTFDNSKVLFYFTADGRVDFRELVRDLASVFKTRIELRQIGVRDEAKMSGGIGMCGRELCCHSYLAEFIPVSIKMAKEQNLSLNPTKISGVCGRLMCCLQHEEEAYEYLNAKMPMVGDNATTKEGVTGKVDSVNVMRQTVRIIFTDEEGNKTAEEFKAEDLKFKPRKKHNKDKNDKSDKSDKFDKNDKNDKDEKGRKHRRGGKISEEERELEELEALELKESGSKLDD